MTERAIVAVMGGTFDPVHLGHLAVAERVRSALQLESVWLLPSGVPPHKESRRISAAFNREAMLRLAISGRRWLELCTLELERGDVCYTVDSLRALRDGSRPVDPIFVLGMDSLIDLVTWRRFRDLIREFDLVVIDRPDRTLHDRLERLHPAVAKRVRLEPVPDLGRGGRIVHLSMTPVAISSSEIRRRVAQGRSIEDLVPAEVALYIRSQGLYEQEDES